MERSTSSFQKVESSGWRLGFGNFFGKEISEWIDTKRWLVQIFLWLFVLNGFLGAVLFILPNLVALEGEVSIENPAIEGTIGFFGLGGIALSVGMIILTQNEIIEEKLSGTAEWVLSKPVARSAFYLSKLSANLLGMAGIMILIPCAVAYTLIEVSHPGAISLANFLIGVGLMSLHVIFYLSLTLMMGVFADSSEVVLGISLGTLFLGMIVRDFLGQLALITPWLLADFAGLAAIGDRLTLDIWIVIITTIFWILVFNGLAMWGFKRLEF